MDNLLRKLFLLALLCGGLFLLGCSAGKSVADGPGKDRSAAKVSSQRGDTVVDVDSDRTGQSLSDYLQRVPGVQIRGDRIYVRNASSIQASDQPLFVIDGNIVSGDLNSISAFLNPNDIDFVEVLKDAASLSEYGARGANGVIRIYTKRE